MKPAVLAQRLAPLTSILRCPRCQSPFTLTEQSLICRNRHCYDLSRRGYVNLAPSHDQASEKYDAMLFDSRRLVFEHGFYQPVAEAIERMIPAEAGIVLDAGCGEGYYARLLADRLVQTQMIGLDISRDAITAAARLPGRANWLVADLKHLPVADASADVVLDVLTPADYAEFRRVLKPQGVLIKVVPGADYLCEVRKAVAPWLRSGDTYDNARVIDHLREHAQIIEDCVVRITRPLSADESHAFLRMTPMTFSVPEEKLETLSLSQITIHMHVLLCRMNEA
ncbi:MAG: methyltransferase domain-containing protein [Clostridia bacterium]|nr:methyltransferase domain-containing protein [Clostridia bacterium]